MKNWIKDRILMSWMLWYVMFMLVYAAFAAVAFCFRSYLAMCLGIVFFAMTLTDFCLKVKEFRSWQDKEKTNEKESRD